MKKGIIIILIAAMLPLFCGATERMPAKRGGTRTTAQYRKSKAGKSAAARKTAKTTGRMEKKNVEDTLVVLQTSMGDIRLRLYNDTPLHKRNFLKLAGEGYYDGLLFHRVIRDFMVQAGDPDSKNAPSGKMLGGGDPGYTVEAEINYPRHYHKYGALAAARTGDQVNPERRSSGSQFYIVTGRKYGSEDLKAMEQRGMMQQKQAYFNKLAAARRDEVQKLYASNDTTGLQHLQQELAEKTEKECKVQPMTEEMLKDYTTIGGTPHLDGQYTVFGEVVEGMDVVEKIQAAETGQADRPITDIKIISARLEPAKADDVKGK